MPGGIYDLNEKKISSTFHRVTQYESGSGNFLDGRGDVITRIVLTGSLSVDTLYVSQSVIDSSGSTKFGDSADDTHTFIGSIISTGSIYISGSDNRLYGTASYADNAISASYIAPYSQTITVAKQGGDFTSLKSAMDSITDNSTSNRYTILIYPGDYNEDNPIQGKDYVAINALGAHEVTRIQCLTGSQHGLIAGKDVDYIGLQIQNCSGSGAAGFWVSGSTEDVDFHDCKIRNCDIGWLFDSSGEALMMRASIITGGSLSIGVKVTSGSVVYINDIITTDDVTCTNWILCESSASKASLFGGHLLGHNTTNGLVVSNGGKIEVSSTHISHIKSSSVWIKNENLGGTISGVGLDLHDSGVYDILVESTSSVLRMVGLNASTDKMSFAAGSDITLIYTDDKVGDKGMKIMGELNVGTPEFPAESVFGEGDSYTRDTLVYTFDTGSDTYTDVSVSASNVNDSLTVGFPSQSIDNAIYVASTLQRTTNYVKHYGVKIQISSSFNAGSGVAYPEYWNGTSWQTIAMMVTQGYGEFKPLANNLEGITGSYQIRYDWRINNNWTKNDPVGYGKNLYWTRYRINSPISESFQLEQIKLHTNRSEINDDGFIEYFGRARPFGTLPWDVGLLYPAAASPGNQDVYLSDTLDVGRTENLFVNGATDRIGFNAYLPEDLDTSCPVQLQWAILGDADEPTNVIGWVIRWGYSTDTEGVYRSTAAPTYAGNGSQQSMSMNVLPPSASDMQKSYNANLNVDNMVSRRGSGSFGDMLWVSLERPTGDDYSGDVAIINITARYTKWCEGGHQFL